MGYLTFASLLLLWWGLACLCIWFLIAGSKNYPISVRIVWVIPILFLFNVFFFMPFFLMNPDDVTGKKSCKTYEILPSHHAWAKHPMQSIRRLP